MKSHEFLRETLPHATASQFNRTLFLNLSLEMVRAAAADSKAFWNFFFFRYNFWLPFSEQNVLSFCPFVSRPLFSFFFAEFPWRQQRWEAWPDFNTSLPIISSRRRFTEGQKQQNAAFKQAEQH